MYYLTLKNLGDIIHKDRKVVDAWTENKWVVALLDNGFRIKFLNY